MEDNVLAAIGRRHTADDIRRAMEQVRRAASRTSTWISSQVFPEDTPAGFARSLDEVISMGADNITVHTLSLKRAAASRLREAAFPARRKLPKCWTMPTPRCVRMVFAPYYLYRQKYMSGSFENVGWTKPGGTGLYNIYIMEEAHSILRSARAARPRWSAAGRSAARSTQSIREYIDRPEKRRANLMDFAHFYAEQGE